MKSNPILTIALPTYNRAKYLNRALSYITQQIEKNNPEIEILVSNNCSPDNTAEIVNNFIQKGWNITYFFNKENIGADKNVAQCFSKALGFYVLIHGDDDVLIEGSISRILKLLKQGNYGLVHLNNQFSKTTQFPITLESKQIVDLSFEIIENKKIYFKKVNWWVTFLTANIIQKNLINFNEILLDEGTSLNQVHIYSEAILNSPQNLFIDDHLIFNGKLEVSWDYKLFTVFVINFNQIMHRLSNKYKLPINNIINRKMLINFIPPLIFITKSNQFNLLKENQSYKIILLKYYFKYIYFWLFIFPIILLPLRLGKFYNRFIGGIFRIFLEKNSIHRNRIFDWCREFLKKGIKPFINKPTINK